MHHYSVVVPLLAVSLISPLLPVPTTAQTVPDSDLTFAENVYVKLSGACRAIMDLRFNPMNTNKELVKAMKIVWLNGNEMKTFPVDESFNALTSALMFDITKQTKIIIHGYKDSSQSQVPLEMAKAYNEKAMFNVLMVDAEEMINKGYIFSVHNSRLVGKRLANLLANLEKFGANAEDFHLLGISLGAHIAGWAGKYFRRYKGRNLGRITGLDPAGPCFSYAYSDQRLDIMDANYVDVVHSNRLMQGVIEPLGHADFYVNGGGPNQPGCYSPSCSHLRAAQVYTESIRTPKSLIGVKCVSWQNFIANKCGKNEFAVLGYGSSSTTRGLYYLRTSARAPFGLGMRGIKNVKVSDDKWLNSLNLT